MELYKKYRPKKLADLVGQDDIVQSLTDLVDKDHVPHAILLSGSSGCGKTTIARILRRSLDCSPHDFTVINAAESRGIDTVRDVVQRMRTAPMLGKCKIFLFDECHSLVTLAQQALLIPLEDTPNHVYFILATTDPGKLIKTILTRCTEFKVVPLDHEMMTGLINKVLKLENKKLSGEVIDQLIEVADGSARKALVVLDQIIDMKNEQEQINTILKADSKRQGIEIARKLLDSKTKWNEVASILKNVEEEPETIRHIILGYAKAVLLNGGGPKADRAFFLINAFEANFYDSKMAGLVRACYEVLTK